MSETTDPARHPRVGLFQTSRGVGGGRAYETELERALEKTCQVEVRNIYPRHLTSLPGKRFRQILAATRDNHWDVTIRGFVPAIALGLRKAGGRQIVLIHHLDHSEVPHTGVSSRLERLFAKALHRAHRLVVVSPFWEEWFSARFSDLAISVVHNGFDVDQYAISPEKTSRFREQFGFDDRPVVYLGNCQRAKGVVEAYEALRDSPYQLVTSGRRDVELPCRHLDISFADYRKLLAASDVVLAVSRFLEGWNRTAHEALLAGTPVVGLPAGGLGDLLEGAGQVVIASPTDLPEAIPEAIERSAELVTTGRNFAREFTLDRFAGSWQHVIAEESGSA
jgi:glycosyltransferase involved in cell wall biosynthesis